MSIRKYNSTKPRRRFYRRISDSRNSKPIDYTEMYKLDGVPVHNAEAVRQFTEKQENYSRQQALEKRRKMRENFAKTKSKPKSQPKKTNDQNKMKTDITNVEIIRKKNKKKISQCLM